jgi:hypothetical protein
MTTRTIKKTVKFNKPFMIGGLEEALPSGDYILEIDKKLLEGLSFPAYRRKSTLIYLHQTSRNLSRREALPTNPNELDVALMRDKSADDIPVGVIADRP